MKNRIEHRNKNKYKIDYVTFVKVIRNENFTFIRKQGKPRHSIIFVENGEIEYTFLKDNKTITFESGSVIFIPKRFPYTARYTKNCTVSKVITFSIDPDNIHSLFRNPTYLKNSDISHIMKSINADNSNSTFYLTAKIYEILYHLNKKEAPDLKKFKKIIPAVDEIKKNYFENKKISYYSNLSNMSESNFRKLFKEYTGKSFIEYRNILRINEAKKLIESNECSVAEAAYITGFNNMSFFYECLKKY